MNAITIRQPFASLIIDGIKKFETRTWQIQPGTRLFLHAGKWDHTKQAHFALSHQFYRNRALIPTQVILGEIEVINCQPCEWLNPSDTERSMGFWQQGNFAWKIDIIETYENPIPAKGNLGIWEYPCLPTSTASPRTPSFATS